MRAFSAIVKLFDLERLDSNQAPRRFATSLSVSALAVEIPLASSAPVF
jgi:hypothetical protein